MTKKKTGAPADECLRGTVTQLAEVLDLHRTTVAKLIRERGVSSTGRRNGRAVYLVRDVVREVRKTAAGEVDIDRLSPFERDAYLRSVEREDRIRTRRGELLDALDVEQRFSALCKTLVQVLETAPDVLERDIGLSAKQAARLERYFDDCRERLYREITGRKGEARNDEQK